VVLKAVELYLNSFLRHQAKYTWAEEPAQVLEEDLWATFEALGVKRPEADRRDASSSRPSDDEWRRPNKAALWEFASETRETAKPGLDRFTSWWTQSATHNRLGRIVFLGTPFYLKAWGGRWFWR
jgi:hypothetical protein